MYRIYQLLVLLMLSYCTLVAQEPQLLQYKTITYNGPSCEGEYQLVFEDDFSDSTLSEQNWIMPPSENYQKTDLLENPWQIWNDPSALGADFKEMIFIQNDKLHLKACKQQDWYTHNLTTDSGSKPLTYNDKNGNPKVLKASWKSSRIISNYKSDEASNPFACFEYGKFCIRAKIAKPQNNIWNAYWFYGPSGEMDMFEIYKNKAALKSNMHYMDCIYACDDGKNRGRKTSYYDFWDVASGVIDPESSNCRLLKNHMWSNAHKLGDLSKDFHEYCLEWTPFKVEWSVDGKVIRTHHQYWKDNGKAWNIEGPYECLESGKVYTLYEDLWFPRDQFTNIILGVSGNGKPGKAYCDEMIVDYLTVWQKKAPFDIALKGNQQDKLKQGDKIDFIIQGEEQLTPIKWEVSSNLKMLTVNGRNISVLANGRGPSWVKAYFANDKSCHLMERTMEFDVNRFPELAIKATVDACSNVAKIQLSGLDELVNTCSILDIKTVSIFRKSRRSVDIRASTAEVTYQLNGTFDLMTYTALVEDEITGQQFSLPGYTVLKACTNP